MFTFMAWIGNVCWSNYASSLLHIDPRNSYRKNLQFNQAPRTMLVCATASAAALVGSVLAARTMHVAAMSKPKANARFAS